MALTASAGRFILSPDGLDELVAVLAKQGYQTLGPTLRGDAIVIDEIQSAADLPRGWGDRQEAGTYRVAERDDQAYFAFAAPAGTWKSYLFPARLTLARAERTAAGVVATSADATVPKRALLGIRGCDLAAIAVQDQVLLNREHPDPTYQARRAGLLLIGVNCSDPADTCFCTSMETGPQVQAGADLTLTELDPDNPRQHRFLVDVGTERGAEIASELTHSTAESSDAAAAQGVVDRARARVHRALPTNGLSELLKSSPDHPQWEDVAARCLSCGNCTMACPTCFCVNVTDEPNVADQSSERVRTWGSCFELGHSYMHGGSVRVSTKSRYRQWMTHKLATWWDQFGSSGCTGCGRCIAWCPVGIDITAEVTVIADDVLGIGGSADPGERHQTVIGRHREAESS